ncbi:MAG: DNA polymerase/3'-5' exonuclease PolX [Anaerolineales bacterium]|nr:DNA polymerase/3'-5' exonuclease PolX [Anaerolineales bacterium]
MNNREIADTFEKIADLLEIKGEVIYKVLAYRRAADSLRELVGDVTEYQERGGFTEIPGVGKAIAEKIEELLSTGKLGFYEKLIREVPETLTDLLQVPDLGPKKVGLFWRELGVVNLKDLEEAAKSGKLRTLAGMGEKSEAKILAGLESLARRTERIPLALAWPAAQEILAKLKPVPAVKIIEVGGSLRRMRATIGDIDLLAAAEDSKEVMRAFVELPDVSRVLSRGETKSSVEFKDGLRAQLWVYPPQRFGTALQYATGSKEHNVRLRELAQKQGLSLSDQAIVKPDGSEILCAEEREVYEILGLPWIPPELREDRGEVQAARKGNLPELLILDDIKGDLQTHSTWSDGKKSILEMAEAARDRGWEYLAVTDHSHSLGVAGGLSEEELRSQHEEIKAVQEKLGRSFRVLHGVEVEIRADGSLDYDDEVLAEMDLVVASLHSGLRQPRQRVTERMLNAIRNPHVDIIAHPTGRLIPDREGADLDMEAIFKAAAEHGVALEINADPYRLDLDDVHARRAVELGVMLAVNSDAHSPEWFDLLHFGVATARRGWVEPQKVINTWTVDRLLDFLKK